ncbi:MAG: hypothetical protein DMG13_20375 [Acidobacteria bacterium]|nr:MAG: hypothetical protein DMG13_20375 [Acidobacteriota bacterium]
MRKDLVRGLAPFLEGKGLKRKSDRETLRIIIAEQIAEIVREEGSLRDNDLRALFEQVHGIDFGQVEREEMEEARSAMFGELGIEIDLSGLRPDMSEGGRDGRKASGRMLKSTNVRSTSGIGARPSAIWRRRSGCGRQQLRKKSIAIV